MTNHFFVLSRSASHQGYHGAKILLKFEVDSLKDETLADCVDSFVKIPSYYENTEQELIDCGIIAKKDGKIVLGDAAFSLVKDQPFLFYSRLKKGSFATLLAIILAYVTYAKLYVSA